MSRKIIINEPSSNDSSFKHWEDRYKILTGKVFNWDDIMATFEDFWFVHKNYELYPLYASWIKEVPNDYHFCTCELLAVTNLGCKCGGK